MDELYANILYAVFDDFPDWSKWSSYKQWLGAQQEFTITDKYKAKKKFTWGKPCIILTNTLPNFEDTNWINLNCTTIFIQNKLYS